MTVSDLTTVHYGKPQTDDAGGMVFRPVCGDEDTTRVAHSWRVVTCLACLKLRPEVG